MNCRTPLVEHLAAEFQKIPINEDCSLQEGVPWIRERRTGIKIIAHDAGTDRIICTCTNMAEACNLVALLRIQRQEVDESINRLRNAIRDKTTP